MSDKRFTIGVVAASGVILAGLVAVYVWLGDQKQPAMPAIEQPPPSRPAIGGGDVAPGLRGATQPATQELPALAPEPALHRVLVGGKFGYIDDAGTIVIKPTFAQALPFDYTEHAAAHDGSGWGLIDSAGRWVLPPRFAAPVHRSRIVTQSEDQDRPPIVTDRVLVCDGSAARTFGYLDEFNAPVIPAVFAFARPFCGGYALASTQPDSYGFIDHRGYWQVPPVYQHARDFREFAAAVWLEGRMGYIDGRGRVVAKFEFEMTPQQAVFSDFSNRRAAVLMDGKWGYIDRAGMVAVSPRFQAARPFSEGLAAVKLGGKWGFIDVNAAMKIKPQFDDVDPADEGDDVYRGGFRCSDRVIINEIVPVGPRTLLAPAAVRGKWGFIGTDGQFVVPAQYKHVGPFRGRLARIVTNSGEGYIDATGKVIFGPTK